MRTAPFLAHSVLSVTFKTKKVESTAFVSIKIKTNYNDFRATFFVWSYVWVEGIKYFKAIRVKAYFHFDYK